MTQRLFLLLTLLGVLLLTALLVYTYPVLPKEERDDPQRVEQMKAWCEQAQQCFLERRFLEAEVQARRILRAEPENLFALRLIIALRCAGNDPEAAEKLCRRLLRSAPEDPIAHTDLGVLLFCRGEKEAGFRELSVAAALRPDDPLIVWNLRRGAEICGLGGSVGTLPPADSRPILMMPPPEAEKKTEVQP